MKATSILSTNPTTAALGQALMSRWTALDTADGSSHRVIVVEAGPDATQVVAQRRRGGEGMVAFEGSRSAVVSPVLQEEARRMLMQMLPVVIDATEQGMTVTLMVSEELGSTAVAVYMLVVRNACIDSGPFDSTFTLNIHLGFRSRRVPRQYPGLVMHEAGPQGLKCGGHHLRLTALHRRDGRQ